MLRRWLPRSRLEPMPQLLECAPDDVGIADSRAFVTGFPDRAVSLGRLAQAAVRSRAMKATGEPGLHGCAFFCPDTVTWAFGTQAAVDAGPPPCASRPSARRRALRQR